MFNLKEIKEVAKKINKISEKINNEKTDYMKELWKELENCLNENNYSEQIKIYKSLKLETIEKTQYKNGGAFGFSDSLTTFYYKPKEKLEIWNLDLKGNTIKEIYRVSMNSSKKLSEEQELAVIILFLKHVIYTEIPYILDKIEENMNDKYYELTKED